MSYRSLAVLRITGEVVRESERLDRAGHALPAPSIVIATALGIDDAIATDEWKPVGPCRVRPPVGAQAHVVALVAARRDACLHCDADRRRDKCRGGAVEHGDEGRL